MVRPRLQLERLDGELLREHYYLHNSSIVEKKVKEMSVLTGSDVLLLAFSPAGIPTLHLGQQSNILDVVTRFSEVSYTDREKRRLDNLQTLRANYQNEEYNIDVHSLFHGWKIKRLKNMQEELKNLKEELNDLNNRRSFWENPRGINDMEKIEEMEEQLKKSLEGVRQRKDNINAEQMISTPESQTPVEHFEDYMSEMLSGNDDLAAYANILMSQDQAASMEKQNQ